MSIGPSVSVLLPVHNGEAWLGAAIESLLAQTHADFEVIVLDDGSTDGSRALAQGVSDPRVVVVPSEARRGLIATLNDGLARARAPLVARQDADDVSHPRRLEWQVAHLAAHPDVALVGGEGRVIDAQGRPRRRIRLPRTHASIRWYQLFDNAFVHTAVMFRTAVVRDALHGYGNALHCEDFDLWSRVTASHRVANLPVEVVWRRVHGASVLRSLDAGEADLAADGNRAVIARNLAVVLGLEGRSEAEAALCARLRKGVPPAEVDAFRALFDRLRREYEARVPEAAGSADFRRTLALQQAQLARGLLRADRGAAVRAAFDAARLDPGTTAALFWEFASGRTAA